MDLFEKCRNYTLVQEAKDAGYYPYFQAIQSGASSTVTVNGKQMIMIGSNNYLGLTQDERVIEASVKAMERFGSGCTGSRFLNGTLSLHEELETKLAEFMGTEAALCFSTGFQTNIGTIAALIGRDDLIFGDRENHASLVDGYKLSFGRAYKFKHNNIEDLDRLLENQNSANGGRLVVSDGVFSMGGDIINLPELVKVAKKHGARIMIDDAHSIGVLGKTGAGTAEHFGLQKDVDLVMGTFSKSFASLGGFIAGDLTVLEYVKHHSRPLIFSASMPPSAVATVLQCLEILQMEPERKDNLWKNTNKMKNAFDQMGYNTGLSETPIIPIIIGEDMLTFQLWRALFEDGVFSNPVVSPAVPPGFSLLRTSYMATHTDEELDKVLALFEKHGKKLGII